MSPVDSTATPVVAPTLEEVAHAQVEPLYDVQALLAAVADRIEAHATMQADDPMHHTLRLAQIAQVQLGAIISAFEPHT